MDDDVSERLQRFVRERAALSGTKVVDQFKAARDSEDWAAGVSLAQVHEAIAEASAAALQAAYSDDDDDVELRESGWLVKKGGSDNTKKKRHRTNWTRRWFRIEGSNLSYYEKSDCAKKARAPCRLRQDRARRASRPAPLAERRGLLLGHERSAGVHEPQ